MSAARRVTVYFEPEVKRASKLKAACSDRFASEMVNGAVRVALAEHAEDLKAFAKRGNEPGTAFEDFVKSLRRRGKL